VIVAESVPNQAAQAEYCQTAYKTPERKKNIKQNYVYLTKMRRPNFLRPHTKHLSDKKYQAKLNVPHQDAQANVWHNA
jgi:hypothetical protein